MKLRVLGISELAAGCAAPHPLPPPLGSIGGSEGNVVVEACIDDKGFLTGDPTVVESSGQQKLDDDAVKLAKAGSGKYVPVTKDGKPVPGCVKFRVKFKVED